MLAHTLCEHRAYRNVMSPSLSVGILVAALLVILGYDDDIILREFDLSPDAPTDLMRVCLAGLRAKKGGCLKSYFRNKVNVEKVRKNLLGLPL